MMPGKQLLELTLGRSTFRLIEGSLLDQPVDAIVNPANPALSNAGGLAAVIARTAGDAWQKECDRLPEVPTGNALAGSAGQLPFKGVIHAVGPVWSGGDRGEANLLGRTIEAVLREAARAGYQSLALPTVSSGIFGYPAREAATVIFHQILRFLEDPDSPPMEIRWCEPDPDKAEKLLLSVMRLAPTQITPDPFTGRLGESGNA